MGREFQNFYNLELSNFIADSPNPCGSYRPNWPIAWKLIRSKSSQEDRACHNLSLMGIEIFCPRVFCSRLKAQVPLFPGYLFGNFPLEYLSSVNSAYGVLKVVQFGQNPAEVPERVIDELRNRIVELPELREFQCGERVRVKSGAFEGWEGIFDKRVSGKDRVKILLSTIFANNSTCYQETRGLSMAVELGLSELVSA